MTHDEPIELMERKVAAALKDEPAVWTADCLPPERILKLVDRALPEPEAATMMAHVGLCARCRREFSETLELLKLAEEVSALEAAKVRDGGEPASTEEMEPRHATGIRKQSLWRSLFAPGFGFAAGAAAAALVLFFAIVQPTRLHHERLDSDIRRQERELARATSEKLSAARELERLKQQSLGATSQLASKVNELNAKVKDQQLRIARLDDAAGALEQIPLPAPEWLPRRTGGLLRGGGKGPDPSILIQLAGPVNTAVENRKPVLEFRPLPGAAHYRLTLELADATEIAPSLRQVSPTQWQPAAPLQPGKLYQWSVTAQRGDQVVRSPMANFYVLSDAQKQELESERKRTGGSSLALGALYARLGIMDEAARQFQSILKADPKNSVARRWLNEIPSHGIEE